MACWISFVGVIVVVVLFGAVQWMKDKEHKQAMEAAKEEHRRWLESLDKSERGL